MESSLKSPMQFCGHCNYGMTPGSTFCTKCGNTNKDVLPHLKIEESSETSTISEDEKHFQKILAVVKQKNKPNLAYVDIKADFLWLAGSQEYCEKRFLEEGWTMRDILSPRHYYIRFTPINKVISQ